MTRVLKAIPAAYHSILLGAQKSLKNLLLEYTASRFIDETTDNTKSIKQTSENKNHGALNEKKVIREILMHINTSKFDLGGLHVYPQTLIDTNWA